MKGVEQKSLSFIMQKEEDIVLFNKNFNNNDVKFMTKQMCVFTSGETLMYVHKVCEPSECK